MQFFAVRFKIMSPESISYHLNTIITNSIIKEIDFDECKFVLNIKKDTIIPREDDFIEFQYKTKNITLRKLMILQFPIPVDDGFIYHGFFLFWDCQDL